MPAMDTVFFKSNHKVMKKCNPPPTIITTDKFKEIQTLANPVLAKTNKDTLTHQLTASLEVKTQLLASERSTRQTGTEDNVEARLEYLRQHKQKAKDRVTEMAVAYEERIKNRTEALVQKQQEQLKDQSEYARRFKSAKEAAVVAKYEKEAEQEKLAKKMQEIEEAKDYRQFIETSAQKEKEFRSTVKQYYTDNKIETAHDQEADMERKLMLKEQSYQQKMKDGETLKSLHQEHIDDIEKEKSHQKVLVEHNRDFYERQLEEQRQIKAQKKLEEQAEDYEMKEQERTKDELFELSKQKQWQIVKNKQDYLERTRADAAGFMLEAKKKKDEQFRQMELATTDGERKKELLNGWNAHWKNLNQDTYEVQQLQSAQKHMLSATEKIEEIALGRTILDAAEVEKEKKRIKKIEQREQMTKAAEQIDKEEAERILLQKEKIEKEKHENKVTLKAQQEAFKETQAKCKQAAANEEDLAVKAAYMQVVKQMDKQDHSVTWVTDIH